MVKEILILIFKEKNMTSDKIEQLKRIHVANPNYYVEDPQRTPKILELKFGCGCLGFLYKLGVEGV